MSIGLVKIIMKAHGDNIAGAVDDLTRIAGFPEEVAQRIATGELPMDEASRVARREAQTAPTDLFHGSTHDIKEFNGQGEPANDWGQGTYLSDSTHDVSRNYAGTHGEDFKARMYNEKEILENEYNRGTRPDLSDGDGSFDTDKGTAAARSSLQGGNEGVIYPLRVRGGRSNHGGSLFDVTDQVELPDYYQQALDDLDYDYAAKNGRLTEAMDQEIEDRLYELEDLDTMWVHSPNPNQNMFAAGHELDVDLSRANMIEQGDTWERVRDNLVDGGRPGDTYASPGAVAGETMKRSGASGVRDSTTNSRLRHMEAGEHTVIFPGHEDMIRSANAAFDPQYKGKNIMGEATVPLLGLLASGSAGAGVLLKSLFAEAEEAERAKK